MGTGPLSIGGRIAALAVALLALGLVATAEGSANPMHDRAGVPGNHVASYCSASHTTCTLIEKRLGAFILAFGTAKPVGKYTLCVTSPTGKRRCGKHSTRKAKNGVRFDGVVFQQEFPHNVKGKYGVTWRFAGKQIGPVLHFVLR